MIDVTAHNEETGTRFPGIITLPSGDEVEADLELGAHRIRLSAAGSPVGAWTFGECRLEATGDGSFELVADEEVLGFAPDDPDGFWLAFLAAFEADRLDPGPGPDPGPSHLHLVEETDDLDDDGSHVADDLPPPGDLAPSEDDLADIGDELPPTERSATEEEAGRLRSGRIRLASAVSAARQTWTDEEDEDEDGHGSVSDHILADLRAKTKVQRFSREDVREGLKKAAIVLVVTVVIGLLAWTTPQMIQALGGEDTASETTAAPTTATTAPAPTTIAPEDATPTTVTAPAAGVFDRPAPEFFSTWNDVGGEVTSVLRFSAFPPAGPFENEFTSFLRSQGVIADDGTLDSFGVVVDPLGPTGSDQLGLQTLGVLIAVVDPSVSPEERAQVLATLGLDVRRPRLGGIDGETVRNGVRYRLVYDSEAVLLTFTVSDAS